MCGIGDRILEVMSDGRERTAEDLANKLQCFKPVEVARVAHEIRRAGRLTSEQVSFGLTVYRIAEARQ